MALTISIEGKGVIANADALTNDTGGLGTGTWHELGGGSISVNPDVYIYGNNSIGNQYASKSGWSYFDIQAGNELDFTPTTGTEDGQFVYMWINIAAGGALDTIANKGLAIRLGSSITDYREWIIGGSDDTNGWTGGWKLFVLDPTIAGTVADTGTFDIASVRMFGVWIDTAASVRADSIWMDQISVGTGIRVTGTSTIAWEDVVNYCTDYTNRAWGAFQERDGIYYSYGKTYIGDSAQTANTSFTDTNRIIQYGTSQFWDGAAWSSSYPTTGSGIVYEDAASFTTTYEDGVLVGTDNGRSGSLILGNNDQDVAVDMSGLTNTGSVVKCYASIFQNLYGGITYHDDINSLFYGGTVSGCGQFDPVGNAVLRNITFTGYTGILGALLWNENIDIQSSQFIANTDITNDPAAIEHPSAAGTPYTYTGLTFSGNDYDVDNSSGSAISISKTGGSNPSTYDLVGGSLVTFTASYTHTLSGMAENTEVTYVLQSDGSVVFHVEDVTVTGTTTYTHSGGELVDILIQHLDYQPDISDIKNITLPDGDATAQIAQFEDPNTTWY